MVRVCLPISWLIILAAPSMAWADASYQYGLSIRAQIEKAKKFPTSALLQGETGKVVLKITIDAKGRVLDSRIIKPSCSDSLNTEALAAVERARPFPPFLPGINRHQLDFVLPLLFARTLQDARMADETAARNDRQPPRPLLSPPPS